MHYQRDGFMRQIINQGGLAIIQQHSIRARSNKFFDHFSQAALFGAANPSRSRNTVQALQFRTRQG